MNRIALITGATAGFGKAIACRLAGESYDDMPCSSCRKHRLTERCFIGNKR